MEIVPVTVNGFDFVPVVKNIISDGVWPPSQEEIEGFAKFADLVKEVEKSCGEKFSHKITLIGLLGGGEGRLYVTRDGGICADRSVAAGKSDVTIDEINKKLARWVNDRERDKTLADYIDRFGYLFYIKYIPLSFFWKLFR